jgi:hypothetical protein
MTTLARDDLGLGIQVARQGASQRLAISGTAATSSAVSQTVCRLSSNVDCYYSLTGTATNASTFLPAFALDSSKTVSGDTFSVITEGDTGFINITDME